MATRSTTRLVAAAIAIGLVAGGCTANGMTRSEEAAAARVAAGSHLPTDSIRPELTQAELDWVTKKLGGGNRHGWPRRPSGRNSSSAHLMQSLTPRTTAVIDEVLSVPSAPHGPS